jgi:hypothetical protein
MMQRRMMTAEEVSAGLTEVERTERWLDLRAFMNRSPARVHQNTLASATYRLFRILALRHLPVIDHNNKCVGMITRKNLLEPIIVRSFAESLKRTSLYHSRKPQAAQEHSTTNSLSKQPNVKDAAPDDGMCVDPCALRPAPCAAVVWCGAVLCAVALRCVALRCALMCGSLLCGVVWCGVQIICWPKSRIWRQPPKRLWWTHAIC